MRALVREHPADYPRDAFAAVTPLRDQARRTLCGRALGAARRGRAAAPTCVRERRDAPAGASRRTPGGGSLRAVLGAGPWRLARQMLTESLVLAVAGGSVGVVRVVVGDRVHRAQRRPDDSANRSRWRRTIDAAVRRRGQRRTGVLFGLAPAVTAWRGALETDCTRADVLSRPSHHTAVRVLIADGTRVRVRAAPGRRPARQELPTVDQCQPWFRPTERPDGESAARRDRVTPRRNGTSRILDAVTDRMQGIPAVSSAAYSSTLPLSHASTTPIRISERPLAADGDAPNLNLSRLDQLFSRHPNPRDERARLPAEG